MVSFSSDILGLTVDSVSSIVLGLIVVSVSSTVLGLIVVSVSSTVLGLTVVSVSSINVGIADPFVVNSVSVISNIPLKFLDLQLSLFHLQFLD